MIRRLFWLLLAFSMAGLTASSLALFAGPSAEVALWSDWSFLGLSRPRWESLHYGLGVLLVLSCLVSLIAGGTRMMGASDEEPDAAPVWITAIIVFAVFVLASGLMLPPGGTLVGMSSSLKSWHAKSFGEPPLAGAANLSPTELAKRLSLDPGKALTNLAAHNVKLHLPDATIAEIARQNGLAPAAVYETLRGGKEPRLPAPAAAQAEAPRPQAPPPPPQLPADPPPGLGRLKLADVCEQYGLNLNTAVDKLGKSGIKASGDMTLRQIAQNNLMLPIEVYDALRGTPQQPQSPVVPASTPPAAQPQPQAAPALPAPSEQVVPQSPAVSPPGALPEQSTAAQQPQTPGQVQPPSAQQAPASTAIAAPEGLGAMTLASFCRDHGLETAQSLAKLKAKGIVAFSDMTFRELAIENNLTPEQVMDLMVK
ncbi:MAG: DUF4405 domain-containing protein [Desulfovibrio sp.]|nr:DUF4405 domain-containing protein [Desulfovibrio sp.]